MEYQNTSSRILYYVAEEETNFKNKAKGCTEDHYHQKFNHKLESSTHIVTSCVHVSSYVMNTLDHNYKLGSIFGQEDDFTTNK